MATYTKGITQVSYNGSDSEYYSHFYYWYWGFKVNGDVVYSERERYLHINSVSITLRVRPKPEYIGHTYLQFYPAPQPGEISVRFRCITSSSNPSGTIYSNRTYSFWTDTSLQDFVLDNCTNAGILDKTYQKTFTRSVNIDLPLTNNKCYLNLYITTAGSDSMASQYTDWGNLTSGTFAYWEPNVPGVQYYTNSGWKTHRIKRWNGSSWVNIPGKRWSGSWGDVKG